MADRGAYVRTYEPFAPTTSAPGADPAPSLEAVLEDAEVVVLLVDHQVFRELEPQQVAAVMPGRVAIDTRGVWDRAAWSEAGFELHVLGVGGSNV
jgi:UDP-N-acetyl-D-mannosaminuronate dehydrogenase